MTDERDAAELDEIRDEAIADGKAAEAADSPVDFRAAACYKLGPEWVGATRDDVFGPAAAQAQAAEREPVPHPLVWTKLCDAYPDGGKLLASSVVRIGEDGVRAAIDGRRSHPWRARLRFRYRGLNSTRWRGQPSSCDVLSWWPSWLPPMQGCGFQRRSHRAAVRWGYRALSSCRWVGEPREVARMVAAWLTLTG